MIHRYTINSEIEAAKERLEAQNLQENHDCCFLWEEEKWQQKLLLSEEEPEDS